MILQQQLSRRLFALLAVFALVLAAVAPILLGSTANAAELDQRSTVIDKAYVNATDVEYIFNFQIPSGGDTAVQGIIIQWCASARAETCSAPTGTGFSVAAATIDAQSFSDAGSSDTAFTDGGSEEGVGSECQETTNAAFEMCLTRTDSDNVDTATDLSLTLSGITHPDTRQSIYPHVYLYDNATFTDTGDTGSHDGAVHFGITAVAVVDQITVSATVAEYLEFCVGTQDADLTTNSTLDNDAAQNCNDFTDTSLNIGTVTFNEICYTDDQATFPNLCDNADYQKAGYAMVSTNASDGVTISYIAEPDGTPGAAGNLGALRVPGADCTAGPADENACFASAGTTQTGFSAGVESFGMTVKEIIQSGSAGYNGAVGTANVTRDAEYDGSGELTANGGVCAGGADEPCWAWDESAPDVIATSSGVVDREHLVMNFAAAASLKTPTGTYSVTSTYIATPQF